MDSACAVPFDDQILDTSRRAVFVPVRHHSPTCARMVSQMVRALRPAAVLIEGPSDFNNRIGELALPHVLPIAIYSYVILNDDSRRGAYYPFCIYSPEWQALVAARDTGAEVRFIDMPWAELAMSNEQEQRYSDSELRFTHFVNELCARTGASGFDALWDSMFEIPRSEPTGTLLRRLHLFCHYSRDMEGEADKTTLQREACMLAHVKEMLNQRDGQVLVITGGFHSGALYRALNSDTVAAPGPRSKPADEIRERGIALTPYSYQKLDSLTGYNAGMPSPGFYHRTWHDRNGDTRENSCTSMLADAAIYLRKRKQTVSAADLIAVQTMSCAIAQLRAHEEPWREDLVDGITSALVKEELSVGIQHPFLAAIADVFRGNARGQLAEGTELPPLVREVQRTLREHDLVPTTAPRDIFLSLETEKDRARSQVLHRVAFLQIGGFLPPAPQPVLRSERWRIEWSPQFDATCIEAASYGSTIRDAVALRLVILARERHGAAEIAKLLQETVLMGYADLASRLQQELIALIREDQELISLAGCVSTLLAICRYEQSVDAADAGGLAVLLNESFARAAWLLDSLGTAQGEDEPAMRAIQLLSQSIQIAPDLLQYDREAFAQILQRVASAEYLLPLVRGAAAGALWFLGNADSAEVLNQMRSHTDPTNLGDFLTGMFSSAREEVQREPAILISIDRYLLEFTDEEFMTALPSMRLAFSYFTPREKHFLADTLLRATGERPAALTALTADAETAARALAIESRLFALAERYGLPGAKP